MKQIETISEFGDALQFELYARKDLAEIIKDAFENVDDYEDFTMCWELKDGTFGMLGQYDKDRRPAVSKIAKLYVDNFGQSIGFYGCELVEDENGWRVEI